MEEDKISVIIPVYNAEKFLKNCLDSLKIQTYKNLEFILIDDGSTDGSAEICKSFCLEDSRFIYVHQDNSGVSAARNKGISLASGEYIGFCDSDDWVEPDMYESLHKLITDNNVDMACCAFFVEKQGNSNKPEDDEKPIVADVQDVLLDIIFDGTRVGGVELWTKLFKREILSGIKFREDIAIGEDAVMMFDALLKCTSIAYVRLFKYHYVFNESSACNRGFKESFWTIQKSADAIYEKTKLNYPDSIYLADKMILLSGLSIAEKLVKAKLLNPANYKRIKEWISPHRNKKAIKAISKRRKISVSIFMFSRVFYCLFRKILNS